MKHYIFLTNQYLPKPGATGLCVHYVAKELVERGHSVNVICYSEDNDSQTTIEGINVIKIKVPYFLRDSGNTSKVLLLKRFFSLFYKLIHYTSYPLRSKSLQNKYEKISHFLINRLGTENTLIVSTYTPIEACAAMVSIKQKYPNIKSCFYSTDTLSNEKGNDGFLSEERRTNKGLKWEKLIFKYSDAILIMDCHKKYYLKQVFNEYHSKMMFSNFPLLRQIEGVVQRKSTDSKIKTFVYAGTLYRYLRNPSLLCRILEEVNKNTRINALFLGGGDCNDIMESYEKSSQGAIRYMGMQSHDIATQYINNADYLLSIGNVESPMAPSKIFEYMATGKPIIHVFSWKYDPCLEPLIQYGNALLINDKEKIDINNVLDFINNSKILSYDKVSNIFRTSTPSYTADLLEKIVFFQKKKG